MSIGKEIVYQRKGLPALGGVVVTPSDTVDLATPCRGILVGTAGDVKVTGFNGVAVVYPALAAGIIHPIAATRIWSTGTVPATIVAVE